MDPGKKPSQHPWKTLELIFTIPSDKKPADDVLFILFCYKALQQMHELDEAIRCKSSGFKVNFMPSSQEENCGKRKLIWHWSGLGSVGVNREEPLTLEWQRLATPEGRMGSPDENGS